MYALLIGNDYNKSVIFNIIKKGITMTYSVGLDIGTGSVGWAVIDSNYRIKRAKGKNLIGVRLFDPAQTAEERRGFRTTRRRLSRRRWRLRLLNEIFSPELVKIDENFLPRLRYSWVNPKDTVNPQFNDGLLGNATVFGSSAADKAYHQKYPTIYHLRLALMNDTEKHDLREIYLAIHHAIKYRGHFLMTGDIDSANVFDAADFIEILKSMRLDEETAVVLGGDATAFEAALTNKSVNRTKRVEEALATLEIENDKASKNAVKAILAGIVGNKLNLNNAFSLDVNDKNDKDQLKDVNFSDADYADKIQAIFDLGYLDDDQQSLVDQFKIVYDGIIVKDLLGAQTSISAAMVKLYETHHEQLVQLRQLRNRYTKKDFDENYKLWITADSDGTRQKPKEYFKKLLQESELPQKDALLDKLELDQAQGQFLPVQRSKENGSIPHQLHLNEVHSIIQHQAQYYPFLQETYDNHQLTKIEELLTFRVPYYVGPLVSETESQHQFKDDAKNHWMVRKNTQTITPWNFNEAVDKDASAKKFIDRLTGTDTYLIGEPTLPKNSLVYQKYNVLQELNNLRLDGQRLDVTLKQDIFEHVFKAKLTVSKNDVIEYISSVLGREKIALTGFADTTKFNSNLGSYHYLRQALGESFITSHKVDELDEIITLQTVFEDKSVLANQLATMQLDLTQQQIDKLTTKHWTGWGRLSHKLLTTPVVNNVGKILPNEFDNMSIKHSIIDTLFATQLNLMEIINNNQDLYEVREWITEENQDTEDGENVYDLIQNLAGGKEIKRGITQSFRILDDIVRAMGEEPERVYLEFARETQDSKRTVSRQQRLIEKYKGHADLKELQAKLNEEASEKFKDDRLYLYYLQQGKDLYTGNDLNIDNLVNYDIDHIVPQAYTKDNSFDNRVLVSQGANREKSNAEGVPNAIRQRCKGLWQKLLKDGFMTRAKYNNLTMNISEKQKERFIARSLVETRQIIKNVAQLIDARFKDTKAVPIRASLTGDMRRYIAVKKIRDLNDYHHAHDALMIATVGEYIENKGFFKKGELSDNAGNAYNIYAKEWLARARKNVYYGRANPYSFVIGSMQNATRGLVDLETGELVPEQNDFWNQDNWNYLHKVLFWKNILVTRKTNIKHNRLYGETILSKDDVNKNNKKVIKRDKNKESELYGGFTKVESSAMMLVRADGKNRLFNVPVMIANQIDHQQLTIDEYVKSLGIKKFEKILKYPIPLKSKINDQNSVYYAVSYAYRHNAKQLWLNEHDYKKLAKVTKHEQFDKEKYQKLDLEDQLEIFDMFANERVMNRFVFYESDIQHLYEVRSYFENADTELKAKIISEIMYILHDDAGWVDPIGKNLGAKARPGWSKLQKESGILLSDNAQFIMESPTGIFTNKITINDLL